MGTSRRITRDDLEVLEEQVATALRARDTSSLNVLGFGEISVALGWPFEAPRYVCKRTPPFSPAECSAYGHTVTTYVSRLQAQGVTVVDTQVMTLERPGRVVAYLVQPMLAPESLGHRVLAGAEPDAGHPFLTALADTVALVTPEVSFDAQVTNFSWDGATPTLVDVGTPFLWDERGDLLVDMKPFTRMLPYPVRRLVEREMDTMLRRWRDPRGVGVDVVANLYRQGLPEWIEPAITALNRRLDPEEPILAAEARAFYDDDLKTWPRLKRLQAAERWWSTTVRRRPYEYFIHSTFDA